MYPESTAVSAGATCLFRELHSSGRRPGCGRVVGRRGALILDDPLDELVKVMALCVILMMVLSTGFALLFPLRKRGRWWGMSPPPVCCPECGNTAPGFRWPK